VSSLSERTLFYLMLDTDSMSVLSLEGLDPEVIPTEELRPIYDWSIRYFNQGGRVVAPTAELYRNSKLANGLSMYDVLAKYDIKLDEPLDDELPTVEWAVEELRSSWLTAKTHEWTRRMTTAVTTALPEDRQNVLAEHATELIGLSLTLEPKVSRIEVGESAADILIDYAQRKLNQGEFRGMGLGLPDVDHWTNGIHSGELAIIAAGPKTGKSYMIDHVALKEWEAGRDVALFTLENSIEMTRDRIACMALGINPTDIDRGLLTPEAEEALADWASDFAKSDTKLHILKPDVKDCTPEQIVMKARLLGAESLLIDQLTFVEPPYRDEKARYIQIRDIMHSIKNLISTGRDQMPCLMAHQINREGMRMARKNGYHRMDDMAEGSEVERTADLSMTMFASEDHRLANRYLLQIVASRRSPTNAWDIAWNIETGIMRVHGEADIDL